jgi:hypothetical protein
MDRTSKICPKLYTIHVIQDFGRTSKQMIPLIYTLMADKTKETYEHVFNILKKQVTLSFVTQKELKSHVRIHKNKLS